MATIATRGETGLKGRHLARIPVAFGVPAALLFGVAGRLDWPAAWVYLALMMAGGAAAIVVFTRYQPGLVQERSTRWRDGKSWDKPFLLILGVLGPSIVQVVCALDKRFGWSPPPRLSMQAAGVFVFSIGAAIIAWAMAVNPFFSAVVRIQTDRGHFVVERGPYQFVRHPGYTGMALATIGGPTVLGTMWGLVPAALLLAAMTVRTVFEDRTLQVELPGYASYAQRVRSRLLPFVW